MPPFDDDEIDLNKQEPTSKKPRLVNEKSVFDNKPKAPSYEQFKERATEVNNKLNDYKSRAADLGIKFKKMAFDKTLPQNKSAITKDVELEVLRDMMKLASEINNDENEREGEGSLGWIAVMLTTFLGYRDRCNVLEYELSELKAQVASLQRSKEAVDG